MPPQIWAYAAKGLIDSMPALIQLFSMAVSEAKGKPLTDADWDKLATLANKAPEVYLQDAIRRAGLGGPMAGPAA